MANPNAPRGFKVVCAAGGAPYNGALNAYRIASGTAGSIFEGDAVQHLATGYVSAAAAGASIRGIARAFFWTGADGVPTTKAYWPGGTVTANAQDAWVLVHDDPDVELEARFGGAATNPQKADVGLLYDLTAGTAGNTATGVSGQAVDIASGATTIKQFRFLGFVDRPDNDVATGSSAYAFGRFVPVNHDLRLQTGI